MGLICPDCGTGSDKLVRGTLEVPRDARSDEIMIQVLKCASCGFRGVGVYEESRRGGLDDESVDHYGYHLDSNEWKRLQDSIKACPDRRNPKCGCPSHKLLNQRNDYGRWQGLSGFKLGDYFSIAYQK